MKTYKVLKCSRGKDAIVFASGLTYKSAAVLCSISEEEIKAYDAGTGCIYVFTEEK
jgi:hypothetical protein